MIFLNNLLPINEENIYSNYGMLLSVNLDPGRSYGKKAYFKLYNSNSYRTATKLIRLHFYDTEYEIHNKGLPLYKLSSNEKIHLMSMLNEPVIYKNIQYNTAWQALIIMYNKKVKQEDQLPLNLPIPDYTKLQYK